VNGPELLARFTAALLPLVCAPALLGIINRTKAVFAGRVGAPLLQPYYDIFKLLRKGAVYSGTTTWVLRAGPVIGVATTLVALACLPLAGLPAPLSFAGDFILVAYLLGLGRFMTINAALDTGSAFCGMGASREAQFGALAEPALLLALAGLAWLTGQWSLSGIYAALSYETWSVAAPALGLITVTLLAVLLTENSRIPVDDPNTHLELTMIHEVMVLDHSGPDFALVEYGAALKLWLTGVLLTGVAVPALTGNPWVNMLLALAALFALAVAIGCIESMMARLRLHKVPQFIAGAGALAAMALLLALEH